MFWSISQSILDGFAQNLHEVGVTFRDDRNEGQQPHVLTKTEHFGRYLSQFLMDLHKTFTK